MTASCVLQALETRRLLSGSPELVLDIQASGNSDPTSLAGVNGKLFFTANGFPEQAQLWTSDGTAGGTEGIKVIRNDGSALIKEITDVNGAAFFSAFDGSTHGLWKSDGTTDGTVLVKSFTGTPRSLTDVNGTLLFYAPTQQTGLELWKSNGTLEGTVLVKDIIPGTSGSFDPNGTPLMVAVGNRAFFTAFDSTGAGLYVSDGTEGGTFLTKDIFPGFSFAYPRALTRLNDDTLMFAGASDNTLQYRLWRSDGTEPGTYLVKDIVMVPSQAEHMAVVDGNVFFTALQSGVTGSELWKSDGTTDGTQIVKDIAPGADGSGPWHITAVGDRVFFAAAVDAPEGLWVSDGTADGTELVKGVPAPGYTQYYADFTDVNGTLYFRARDAEVTLPFQVFRSDGTEPGTVPLIIPNGGNPAELTNVNGTLFFAADDTAHGRELWKIAPPTQPAWLSPGPGAQYTLVNNLLTVTQGTVTFTGDASSTHPGLNVTVQGGATVIFAAAQHLGTLTLNGTGHASVAAHGSRYLVLTGLAIGPAATLDMFDNDLLLDYTGASQLAAVQTLINTGRSGGSWTGTGITSSSARVAPNSNTTLGAMESSDYLMYYGAGATFAGQPLDSTMVLVKYTYYGDTDFSGYVDFDDYVNTDLGYNTNGTTWLRGDTDGSGVIDFDDYVLIDLAFNTQGAAL